MMNMLEEAIIYSAMMHKGQVRKFGDFPYIFHPLEVAQILSTMTDDEEVVTAGILHDIVEDTDGSVKDIENRFGKRVAMIVAYETENKYPEEDRSATWKRRKEYSLAALRSSNDQGIQMLWLADKLANLRSLARIYSEIGDAMWEGLNEKDPELQRWYYKSVAEALELSFNKTGAFKEYIKHINSIWPGTFDSEKARYKKYREVSVDGCKMVGRGAKGEVYRYDDELVIKVYNEKNTYRDVENEIATSRKAFVLGVPTAISFGIVSVGDRYGAMYELVDSETISSIISKSPGRVENYADIMADLAHEVHAIEVTEEDGFGRAEDRHIRRIDRGLANEDAALAERCRQLVNGLSDANTLILVDFHTGNVFLQRGEPLLIDMDRVSVGHPVFEIGDLLMAYVVRGEDDPAVVSDYMGFSYETAKKFFDRFLRHYLDTDDENRLQEVTDKAMILCAIRVIGKFYEKGVEAENREIIERNLERLRTLTAKYDTLSF